MNIQSVKSKLVKGQTDFTKEVVVVLDNKEYEVIGVSNSVDKVAITVAVKETIEVGDLDDTPVEPVEPVKAEKDESGTTKD